MSYTSEIHTLSPNLRNSFHLGDWLENGPSKLAVAGNQKALNVDRIAERRRSPEDCLDQLRNRAQFQTHVRERCLRPAIVLRNRRLVNIRSGRRRNARAKKPSAVVLPDLDMVVGITGGDYSERESSFPGNRNLCRTPSSRLRWRGKIANSVPPTRASERSSSTSA